MNIKNQVYDFLGGSLTFHFREDVSPEIKIIEIKINFLKNEYFNFIKEECSFIKINNIILITYKDIQKYLKDKIYSLIIVIEYKKITLSFNYTDHSSNEQNKSNKNKDKIKTLVKSLNFPKIKDIIFFDNFYGEVKLITINFKKIINKKQIELYFEKIYKPFLETNSGYLKIENDSLSLVNKDIESSGNIKKTNRVNVSLIITDKNFTKVNYINHTTYGSFWSTSTWS